MADQHDLARGLLELAHDDHVAANALLDVAAVSDAIVGFTRNSRQEGTEGRTCSPGGCDISVYALCRPPDSALRRRRDRHATVAGRRRPPDAYGVALRYGAKSPGTVDRRTALDLAGAAISWARGVIEN